jgi:hypothetical protein
LRLRALQLFERITPNIGGAYRPWDRSSGGVRELDIALGRADVVLGQVRCARLREDLVDTAAGHDVAAKKQCQVA